MARTDWLCELCGKEGVVRAASVVDHIVPLAKGGLDVDANTRNVCDEHNRAVTAEQFGHRERLAFAADGLPVDPDDPWRTAQ